MADPKMPLLPNAAGPDRAWYEVAFGADYRRLYAHRDAAEARRTVDFLCSQGLSGPVLDLACGAGRHLAALAEAGLVAVGLDLSPSQLEASACPGRVLRADFRRIPLAEASMRAVVSLFSSFGYLPTAGEDAAVLEQVRRVLVSGGELFLDVMNAPLVRAKLVHESRREHLGDLVVERRELTAGGQRVRKTIELCGPGGARSWHEDVALYDREGLEELLVAAGLEPIGAWGGYDGRPSGPDAPRLILRARAR